MKTSHGQPAAKSFHGEPVMKSSHGEPAAKPSRGQPAAKTSHGEPVMKTSHGEPAVKRSHGEPAAKTSLGELVMKTHNIEPVVKTPNGEPAAKRRKVHKTDAAESLLILSRTFFSRTKERKQLSENRGISDNKTPKLFDRETPMAMTSWYCKVEENTELEGKGFIGGMMSCISPDHRIS